MEDSVVPGTAQCCPRHRQQSTLLALIRTRRETGKVQAGVKKAQGGSSRISLTSQRVQPRCSAATGTLQCRAVPCRGSGHHHQIQPTVTINGPFLLPDTGRAGPPAGGGFGETPAVPTSHAKNEVFSWRHEASKDENHCGKGKTAQICPYPPARPVPACPGPYPSRDGSASPAQPSLLATPRCMALLQGNGQCCLCHLLPAALTGPWHPMAWPCCLHLTAPHHQRPL